MRRNKNSTHRELARDARWQLPGRAHHGESPAAATREPREETGLSLPAEHLITVARIPAGSPDRHDRIAFVFATRTLRPRDLTAITLRTSEVDDRQLTPAWYATRRLHPLIVERLTEAGCHYIEQGPTSIRERAAMP
ncbi:NUDIX domain-containing protein [Streptosporangium oxazolinicum]|uniref:NUDIX domain-containing protein n=1 Tax=Streptosporangium oxazolinicum TaxID=909287 RepID=UPI003CD08833